VTGRLKFADDLHLSDMLYGAILFAEFPHARIVKIDISRAEKMPGVHAVLTSRDVPGPNVIGPIFWIDQSSQIRGFVSSVILWRRIR
jgi:CO/xanthine dehydrogenase Mo-binding subunit